MAKASSKKKQKSKNSSKTMKAKSAQILTAQATKPKAKKKISKVLTASAVAPKQSSFNKAKKAKPRTEAQRIQAVHFLVEDNYESGKRLAWSFLNKWRVRIEEDEVTSITGAALCEAANRFKPELGVNFKTFLFYYLRGMLLKEITKRVTDSKFRAPSFQHLQEANDDARGFALENYYQADHENTPETILDQKQRIELCREATQGLDVLEQKVLERFFSEDESVVDIAKSLGYCRCHISRVKSKALTSLTEKLAVLSPEVEIESEVASSSKDTMALARRKYYRGVRGRRKSFDSIAA